MKDGKSGYGYFLLHIEDLVDESIDVKFNAMKQLAEWVNSTVPNDYLCCLAVRGSTFMGSHDRTDRSHIKSASEHSAQVKERYGKWKSHTASNPKLHQELHTVGKEGLKELGYEPLRKMANERSEFSDGYQCRLSPSDCGVDVAQTNPTKYKTCTLVEGTDYRGGNVDLDMTSANTVDECCVACQTHSICGYFTYDLAKKLCYMKTGTGNIITGAEVATLTSGYLNKI